ncbi:hypothetical protein AQJ30_26255 [Streptomyces longwoodensis]|uniref:Uncharacterized protein n=1 Tax=Streptomyces longwoodensis TaxID=68231 RepID=A0A101QS02_9ACTN|nr:hypothetical protein [Streptomyces longwoodensis]KUN34985.1 hypothetical protein AQJ30_26255 [Streptomyces longwoodensis]
MYELELQQLRSAELIRQADQERLAREVVRGRRAARREAAGRTAAREGDAGPSDTSRTGPTSHTGHARRSWRLRSTRAA